MWISLTFLYDTSHWLMWLYFYYAPTGIYILKHLYNFRITPHTKSVRNINGLGIVVTEIFNYKKWDFLKITRIQLEKVNCKIMCQLVNILVTDSPWTDSPSHVRLKTFMDKCLELCPNLYEFEPCLHVQLFDWILFWNKVDRSSEKLKQMSVVKSPLDWYQAASDIFFENRWIFIRRQVCACFWCF
jgi:hypothetical protein